MDQRRDFDCGGKRQMTRIQYDLLVKERADLRMPPWISLWERERVVVKTLTREQLVAHLCARILSGEANKLYAPYFF
jgi:hypothetical protein